MASLYHVKGGQLLRIPDDDDKTCCKMCLEKAKPDDGIDLGALYEYGHPVVDPDGHHDVEVYCSHYFCLMFSSGLDQRGESEDVGLMGFLPEDVLREWRRGRHLKCTECGKKSAAVGCSEKSCKKTFHLPCAIRSGSLTQFCDEFSVFCADHRPQQRVFASQPHIMRKKISCGICYDTIKWMKGDDPLWSPCCNKWFHRKCIQQFATSSGYFFKCPMCNNKDEFEREMKLFGIYVPEKDAAWEQGSNFEDLYERHDTCDAQVCLCDEGRKKDVDYTEWEIILCRCCGARGVHVKCGGLSLSRVKWTCNFCSDVVKRLPPTIIHSFKPVNRRKSSTRCKMSVLLKKSSIRVSGKSITFTLPGLSVSSELLDSGKVPQSVKVPSHEEKASSDEKVSLKEEEAADHQNEEVAIKKKIAITSKIARESTPPPQLLRTPGSPCIKRLTSSPKMLQKKFKATKQQSILNYFKMDP